MIHTYIYVLFVLCLSVYFMYVCVCVCVCVLYYFHREAPQLQLINISYHIISYHLSGGAFNRCTRLKWN